MKVEDISKTYHLKNEDIQALKMFSFDFKPGLFYAIKGHSGSGKSTLIRILGLMDDFDNGSFNFDGENINNMSETQKAKIRLYKIGFVFQDFWLDENLKLRENVILPMIINKKINKNDRTTICNNLLKLVDLEEKKDHYPKELSGGEQQRTCLARALANNPSYILCDEPTGNLDKKNEEKIFKVLKYLSQNGRCVIVVSHSDEVNKYADRILELENGELIKK